MVTRSLQHMNQLIVDNLHLIRKIPCDAIVHIPRSGTIPGSLLATYLPKPLLSVDEFCAGIVNKKQFKRVLPEQIKSILVIDDSIRTADQMLQNLAKIKAWRPDVTVYTLAIYSTKTNRTFQPSLFLAEHTDDDYMYPWFIWKSKRIKGCAIDMDGVICRDCTKEEDDDGVKYQKFLRTAEVKFHTRFPITAIVTSRLEKYRFQTEDWLHRNGFKYEKLVMGPWATKEQRKGNQASYKAAYYKHSSEWLYIESSEKEAKEIARLSHKPVWCIDTSMEYR